LKERFQISHFSNTQGSVVSDGGTKVSVGKSGRGVQVGGAVDVKSGVAVEDAVAVGTAVVGSGVSVGVAVCVSVSNGVSVSVDVSVGLAVWVGLLCGVNVGLPGTNKLGEGVMVKMGVRVEKVGAVGVVLIVGAIRMATNPAQ